MRLFAAIFAITLFTGCSTQHPNRTPVGEVFPTVSGTSLKDTTYQIPADFSGRKVLFLLGYKQASQFDIDRWLIGLDMTQTQVEVYELPTIQGVAPRMISGMIDNGMRNGIPQQLWKSVITIYADGDQVQSFTGNQRPNNARVVLLNGSGEVIYFYDRGFSVDALNALRMAVNG